MKTYSFLYKKNLKRGILKIKFEISEVWNFILFKKNEFENFGNLFENGISK